MHLEVGRVEPLVLWTTRWVTPRMVRRLTKQCVDVNVRRLVCQCDFANPHAHNINQRCRHVRNNESSFFFLYSGSDSLLINVML